MQDAKIIVLLFKRDEEAISALREKYGKYLSKIAYNILRDTLDAEEALNDAVFKAWNAIPPNRPSDLRSYLVKLTRHSAIDILRKRSGGKRGNPELDVSIDEFCEAVSDLGNPEDELDVKLLGEELNNWLGSLNRERRNIFIMRYFYADRISDIARATGYTEANVKTLLCRMRGELKEYLIGKTFFTEFKRSAENE